MNPDEITERSFREPILTVDGPKTYLIGPQFTKFYGWPLNKNFEKIMDSPNFQIYGWPQIPNNLWMAPTSKKQQFGL